MLPPDPRLWVILLIGSFLLTVFSVVALHRFAVKVGMVDPSAFRPVGPAGKLCLLPTIGGICIYLAIVSLTIAFNRADRCIIWVLILSLPVITLGMIDDRIGLRARLRLAIQFACAAATAAAGISFDWFGWNLMNWIVTVLWFMGMMNAFNCLDCADGAAPGIGAIAFLAFCSIAATHHQPSVALLALAGFGAGSGFLVFNFPPASAFLGNGGSALLGFLLAVLAILSIRGAPVLTQIWIAALPMALPIWDIVFVHFRRYRAGTRGLCVLLASKGQDHFPHRLARAGLGPTQVAIIIYLITAGFAFSAILIVHHLVGGFIAAVATAIIVVTIEARIPRNFKGLTTTVNALTQGAE